MLPEAALTSFIATLFSMMNPIGNPWFSSD